MDRLMEKSGRSRVTRRTLCTGRWKRSTLSFCQRFVIASMKSVHSFPTYLPSAGTNDGSKTRKTPDDGRDKTSTLHQLGLIVSVFALSCLAVCTSYRCRVDFFVPRRLSLCCVTRQMFCAAATAGANTTVTLSVHKNGFATGTERGCTSTSTARLPSRGPLPSSTTRALRAPHRAGMALLCTATPRSTSPQRFRVR